MNAEANRSASFVAGNVFDKYRTRNPLYRRLMGGFLAAARSLVAQVAPRNVLEVGCGPGDLAAELFDDSVEYVGLDRSEAEIATARRRRPRSRFLAASAYDLPFEDRRFDLVVVCEVLEHLERPGAALSEIARVSSRDVLVSVPWEPAWSALNLARGAYVLRLGNTPGHVQRFSRRAIRSLLRTRLELVAERDPFPWTMLLARTRPAPR